MNVKVCYEKGKSMFKADTWTDYELIDSASGEKLERWGSHILRRPDPTAVWSDKSSPLWDKAAAVYHRSNKGGGSWEYKARLPERWTVGFEGMTFHIKPMNFKHTGLFPEQAANWVWFRDLIKQADRPVRVLNLFAYTGGATVAALAGASVTHVDAAKGMVSWAKENVNSLRIQGCRYPLHRRRCVKVRRRGEQRRGKTYDVVIGPAVLRGGAVGRGLKIENELYPLVRVYENPFDAPLVFLINSYTTGLNASVLYNILSLTMKKRFGGTIDADELGIPDARKAGASLPCGISGRWQAN